MSDMTERIESLRRIVAWGLGEGKQNMIVDLEVLQAALNAPEPSRMAPDAFWPGKWLYIGAGIPAALLGDSGPTNYASRKLAEEQFGGTS
jgi:hypothetical protein